MKKQNSQRTEDAAIDLANSFRKVLIDWADQYKHAKFTNADTLSITTAAMAAVAVLIGETAGLPPLIVGYGLMQAISSFEEDLPRIRRAVKAKTMKKKTVNPKGGGHASTATVARRRRTH